MMRPFTRSGLLALAPHAWGFGFAPIERTPPRLFETAGDTAIVTISGPLTQHNEWSWWGCDNYDAIKERVGAALESPATSIVLRIDSPGGDAAGSFELARWIRETAAAAGKQVYAFTDGLAASAAYALACSADAGIYLAPTARVGSVGTILVTVDQSAMDQQFGLRFTVITSGAHKADGHPHVPTSKEAVAEMQSQIDEYGAMFFAHVAEMRPGLSADQVKALEARIFIGASAVEQGLANAVHTFDALLAMVAGGATAELSGAKDTTDMNMKEMLAALKEKAEGDGEEAEQAKKMLKALESDDKDAKSEGEDDDKKKDDEESPPSSKKEPKEDDDEDSAEASTGAAAGASTVGELAAQIQKLEGKLSKIEGSGKENERRELLAKHPSLAKSLVDVCLKKNKAGAFITPMSAVREICKSAPAPKKDPAAAAKIAPTQAIGQDGSALSGVTYASERAKEFDEKFGLTGKAGAIQRDGAKVTFGAMTSSEARAHREALAKKQAAQTANATTKEKQ